MSVCGTLCLCGTAGLGSEDCQPFNMTLEAEMMVEQLKAQHLQQVENLRAQMETKVKPETQSTDSASHLHVF